MSRIPIDPFAQLAEFTKDLPGGGVMALPSYLFTPELLKALAQGDPTERIFELRGRASARDLVIETVGAIEVLVTEVLRCAVHDEARDRLFSKQGKIRDFEVKLELAFGFKIVSKTELDVLHLLRQIRNQFAHDPNMREFEHDRKVIGWTHSIPPDHLFPLPFPAVGLRDRFVGAVFQKTTRLQQRLSEFGDK